MNNKYSELENSWFT